MTKANALIVGAAAVAVTWGVTQEGNIPMQLQQTPLWNGDIVIVKDEAAPSNMMTGASSGQNQSE